MPFASLSSTIASPLFTFMHLYFARQNVQASSVLAYRKDSFLQSVKEDASRAQFLCITPLKSLDAAALRTCGPAAPNFRLIPADFPFRPRPARW